jgi:carboxypeptidase Taq
MSSCAYELEQDLLSRAAGGRDIPEAWDAKMRDYLGLSTIDNPARRPDAGRALAGGAFGYFPSYTLGAMMAAQQWAALKREHPSVRGRSRERPLRRHQRLAAQTDIWSQGSRWSTPELLERATGERLNAAHFIDHLKTRYGG